MSHAYGGEDSFTPLYKDSKGALFKLRIPWVTILGRAIGISTSDMRLTRRLDHLVLCDWSTRGVQPLGAQPNMLLFFSLSFPFFGYSFCVFHFRIWVQTWPISLFPTGGFPVCMEVTLHLICFFPDELKIGGTRPKEFRVVISQIKNKRKSHSSKWSPF